MAESVGIYDLWVNGGGGGEKKALALAEHLSRNHLVWLIVGEEPDKAALESYFGVDLSRVRVFVPRRPILTGLQRLARSVPFPLRRAMNVQMLLETMDRLAETAVLPPDQGSRARRLHQLPVGQPAPLSRTARAIYVHVPACA